MRSRKRKKKKKDLEAEKDFWKEWQDKDLAKDLAAERRIANWLKARREKERERELGQTQRGAETCGGVDPPETSGAPPGSSGSGLLVFGHER